MLDGRIDTQGSIKDLEAQGVLGIIIHDSELERKPDSAGTRTPSDDAETVAEAVVEEKAVDNSAPEHTRVNTDATMVSTQTPSSKKKARKLVKEEERAKGNVKWNIYKTYLEAAGWFTWVFLAIFVTGYQVRSKLVVWYFV